ncbi:Phenylpropionate dioxygenase [Minicystis rosea]|nr:Phenylpropionate dioxygenase [Minicystis rosea]
MDPSPLPERFALRDRHVPKARYVSSEFLALELDRVFSRVWHLAGPAADLDRTGAYFTFEIGSDSVLVVRQADGVRAFHNVCTHRGRALREPGIGHARTFRCPYHRWEFAIDGALVDVPDAEAFAGCKARSELGLRPVAAEIWEGFVWINLAPNPEPLLDFLGPVAERLAAYRLEDYALEQDQTLDIECNWKVGVDAFNEAYHLGSVHPQLLQMLDETRVAIELYGRHSCIRVPFGVASPNSAAPETVNDLLKYLLQEAGINPSTFTGPASAVRGAIQRTLRGRADFDLSRLTDDQITDNHQYYVFPNLTLNVYGMKHMLLRHRPHPTDPHRMLLDQQQYVRVPRGGKRPPRPKPERFLYGQGSLGFVTDQDTFNLVRVQRGMRSRGFDELVLGTAESRLLHMHQVIDEYLAR